MATTIEAIFAEHVATHLAKDQAMNRDSGYLPTASVLAQRELHRQANVVRKIGESIRAGFWQEWAKTPRCAKLQVGFRDNGDQAIARLRPLLVAAGYRLVTRAGSHFVILNSVLAGQVQARHVDWLKLLAIH